MQQVSINNILAKVYGVRGLPFPKGPDKQTGSPIAGTFAPVIVGQDDVSINGTALYKQNALGAWVFLPATLTGKDAKGATVVYDLPNPLIYISGEKSFIETDVVDAGTVFEKCFTRPYDITIICTLINADNRWPEADIRNFEKMWRDGDLYTLDCAITDIFLQPKDNFLLQRIAVLDMQGVENCQVIELRGRSNIDFELEIK